jgi:hypothetical protein
MRLPQNPKLETSLKNCKRAPTLPFGLSSFEFDSRIRDSEFESSALQSSSSASGIDGGARAKVPEDAVLLPPQWHFDFAISPGKNHSAVLDRLHRDLVSLGANLKPELLPFLHDLAIYDSEVLGISEGN